MVLRRLAVDETPKPLRANRTLGDGRPVRLRAVRGGRILAVSPDSPPVLYEKDGTRSPIQFVK